VTGGHEDAPIGIDPEEAARLALRAAPLLSSPLVRLFDASFIRSHALYDEFVFRLALRICRETGVETAAREGGTAEAIAARAGFDPRQAVVPLGWLLRHLAARGVLDRVGEAADAGPSFRARGPAPRLDPGPALEAQRQHDPSWLPSYALAETVARDYGPFLRGETSGENVLFSASRLRLWVDYFSNDNGLYAVNNRVGAAAVAAWWPRRPGTVLELGAGLGSGAIALLETLDRAGRLGDVIEYRFTDPVPAFLRRGQRALVARFPDAGFLVFGDLDMNRPFGEQGVEPGSVSLVYAVNTVHVAHDLAFTLGEVRRALAPGGWLVIGECVRPRAGETVYAELVFNLMETFRAPLLHPGYRPNGGFLTPEQWTAALEAAGFGGVRLLPDIAALRDRLPGFSVAAVGAARPAE
jgi:SAM-dependent methyltransferase